jgi:phage tail-like protein
MPAATADPYRNFNFLVEIDGISASFSECSGLETEVSVIEYREAGDHTTRKIPGMQKVGDITLKRGVTNSRELQDWHRNVLNGQPDRRNGVVSLLDETGQKKVAWKIFNVFPIKWEGPSLNAKGNEIAIETLVLCCERLERE